MSASLPPAPGLLLAIAAALGELAREAEDFGLGLCADAEVASRYLVRLQQIDRLSQSLREIERVLSARDPHGAVREICLGDLRKQLEQALGS
jgi:hypothetical protein